MIITFPEAAIRFSDEQINNVTLLTRAKADSSEFREAIMTASPKLTDCTDGSSMTTLTVGKQLSNCPDVFSDKPGRTDLIQHTPRVTDDIPNYQSPHLTQKPSVNQLEMNQI